MNRWLLFMRLQAISLLEHAAHCLYPRNSVQAAERDARRRVRREHGDFLALLEQTYNLVVRFKVHFHDRELRSLSARECAALLLFGRIANALRRIQADAENAYGPDACGQAASLFEFCWTASYLCGDEQAAQAWIARKHLSEGMDMRTAITRYLTRRSIPLRQPMPTERPPTYGSSCSLQARLNIGRRALCLDSGWERIRKLIP